MKNLNLHIENSIGLLEWDQKDSSVNLLSFSFMEEISTLIKELESQKLKALVMISKKKEHFSAGADLKAFQKISSIEELGKRLDKAHELFCRFENLKLTKIIAIEGECLGGALEWALCFDWVLLSDSRQTKLSLPEVRLGLIPGLGGSLRLPRRIGLFPSLSLILKGRKIGSREALKMGLADERIPSLVLKKRALELAKQLGLQNKKSENFYKDKYPFSFFLEKVFLIFFSWKARRQILKKTKGFYKAPLQAFQVIRKTYGLPVSKKNLEVEKKAFCQIFQSPEAKNLINVWNMMDKARSLKTKDSSEENIDIKTVGVLGAGVMGRRIAWLFAEGGLPVRLFDKEGRQLSSALKEMKQLWTGKMKKGEINSYEFKQKLSQVSLSQTFEGLSSLDLLIEALPENKKLKQEMIKEFSKKLRSDSLIASNTSSFSISDLAKSSSCPENFFGLHFFNPADKMPLVEIALRKEQKNFPINTIKSLLKGFGKTPLLVKDSPGFIVNRLLSVYLTEALFLFDEGSEIPYIDHCYKNLFGFPLGPFELMDNIGLDICRDFIKHFMELGRISDGPDWASELPQTLGLGKKSGRGFYIYKNKPSFFDKMIKVFYIYNKSRALNPRTKNLKRRFFNNPLSEEMVIQRGISRMLSEREKMIKQGLVSSKEDIDLALILGAGFPAFHGGLTNYAKNQGLIPD